MRQFARACTCGFVTSWLLVTACGAKSSTGRAVPESLLQAQDDAVYAVCSGFGTCCASKGFAFNAEACDAAVRTNLTPDIICPSPGIFNPQAAAECFAEMEAGNAACVRETSTSAACRRMCSGAARPGEPCGSDVACAQPADGESHCLSFNAGDTARCVTEHRGKLGSNCEYTIIMTSDDSWTYGGPSEISSDPTPHDQENCFTSDGLYCAPDFTCQAQKEIGATCRFDEDCIAGSACDILHNRCVARVAVGMPCSSTSTTECMEDAYCSAVADCAGSLFCNVDGVCTTKLVQGQRCAVDDQCFAYCDVTTHACVGGARQPEVTAASCGAPGADGV